MKNQFNDLKFNLSALDIDQILALVGKGCRDNTKARLRSILTCGPGTIQDCGIMRRLTRDSTGWDYCAGQDYTAEIKTVRNVILGKV